MILQVVMHTHTPYATALGCLEDPSLLMTHQNSCRSALGSDLVY